VEKSFSNCSKFQPLKLRCVKERFFKLLKASSFKKVLYQCYKFKIKFQVCASKFFKCLKVFCKGFCDI